MTNVYLTCTTHDPELRSGTVGTLAELDQIRKDILNAEEIAYAIKKLELPINASAERAEAIRFVSLHPNCGKEIWSEDGERIPLYPDESGERTPWGHSHTPLGVVKSVLFTNEGLTIEFGSLTAEGRKLLNLDIPKSKENRNG